jgi:hypothetical protein
VRADDVGVALDVVVRFLHLLADPVSLSSRTGE